jgi:Tol biopolymer transport system component
VWSLAPEPPAPRPIHLGVPLPPDVQQVTAVGVSPDGQTLAWVGLEGTGSRATLYSNVYVRSVHQPTTRRFPDTNGTQSVEFSPDGTRLLTWQIDQGAARFNVRVIPIDGGPPVTTLSTPFAGDLMAWSACWETNETLLILSRDGTRLMRVPASGGTPTEVATLEWDDEVPYSLRAPQGERGRVLISALSAEADGGEGGASRIHWIDLDTGRRRLLVDDGAGAFFTGGDVLTFLRIGDPSTVMTAPVDLDRGELTGPVRPRISDVSQVFAAAGDSVLYVPADASSLTESSIVAIDTSGAEEILHDSFAFYSDPRLSPDGRWLAFQALESGASFSRVWLLDLGSRLVRPLSASPDRAASPRWLPDGRLSYTVLSDDPRRRRCVVIDPRRGGSPEPLFPEQPDRALAFADLTSDGTYALAAYAPDDGREGGIYVHRVGSEDPPVEFFATSAVEGFVSISPDDRWVAFHSNSSGTYEVYLRRLAPDDQESAPVYPLSRGGGGWPTWSPDGRSIYYFGAADLVRVDVALGDGEAEISAPETVLQLDGMASNADVFPSGERFVCVRAGGGAEEGRELRVILDWPARWDR